MEVTKGKDAFHRARTTCSLLTNLKIRTIQGDAWRNRQIPFAPFGMISASLLEIRSLNVRWKFVMKRLSLILNCTVDSTRIFLCLLGGNKVQNGVDGKFAFVETQVCNRPFFAFPRINLIERSATDHGNKEF